MERLWQIEDVCDEMCIIVLARGEDESMKLGPLNCGDDSDDDVSQDFGRWDRGDIDVLSR